MAVPKQVGRWAKAALVLALTIALVGLWLHRSGQAVILGGVLLAFGEAALVGGLADWFAVRALFAHPFGIPFPHSALIPRNRRRIVSELRGLVENEWLPKPMLLARVHEFDFTGGLILPFTRAHRETMRSVMRTAARNVLDDVSAPRVAGFLAGATAKVLEADQLAPFLAQVARRAREEAWLGPVIREWLRKLVDWVNSRESHRTIYDHLQQAATAYREKGWFKNFTYSLGEWFGGVDLYGAASLLQHEVGRFASEQGVDGSALQQAVHAGLANVERRLLQDEDFVAGLQRFLAESSDAGVLPSLFEAVVSAVKAEGLRELDRPESPLLAWAVQRLERWLEVLEKDPEVREQVNGWCRQLGTTLVDRHHPVIGLLVEEQLNRLSDESLVSLIEDKVGEDLNWIRLNGTVVGGLIGVALYLLFALLGGV
jgi:uncharacterized membrane-anchored protein YjiN (DUF445 family)